MLNKVEYTVSHEQLDRMELFDNRKTRWTMEQVQERTGCDVVFPGPYFDGFDPVVYCKIDGKFLCNPGYSNYGVILDHGRPYLGKVPNDASDYWTNDVLIINGMKRLKENMHLHADSYQKRGRAVVMGFPDGSVMFRATRDGGPCADTVLGEQENAHKRGTVWAVGNDGGRSANIITPNGSILINDYGVNHTRIMPVYIIAYLKKENKPTPKKGEITTVHTYSVKKDGDKKLSPNFRVREFACHDGSDAVLIDTELVKVLQKIRDAFGRAVLINSAYRTKTWNKKNGGATHSQHLLGKAADIHLDGVRVEDVAGYAEYLRVGGLGMYKSFTHVDTRNGHARWRGDGKPYTIPKMSNTEEPDNVPNVDTDVSPVHREAVAWCKERGITDGSRIKEPPTKEEICSMFFRARNK